MQVEEVKTSGNADGSRTMSSGTSSVTAGLVCATLAVTVLAGCGSSETSQPSTSSAASSQSANADSAAKALPGYKPSTVVSDNPGSLQLRSPDSVAQVTAFYDKALSGGGWTIVSSSKTPASTSITAKKNGTGTTLAVSSTGSGSYISLTTYPAP
jgi:hypothetical protein